MSTPVSIASVPWDAANNRFDSRFGSPYPSYGTIIHVDQNHPHASDTTGNGTLSKPYLTILKAMKVLPPSGTVVVHAGTYAEVAHNNPSGFPDTKWKGAIYASIGMMTSGTPSEPCVLMAAPGDEGLVTISGSGTYAGIVSRLQSYWRISGIRVVNCHTIGIGSEGEPDDNHIPVDSKLTKGWTIENCYIENVQGSEGSNTSAIGPWSSQDWTIRNVKIRNVGAEGDQVASAVQSYGMIRGLIENCDFEVGDAFGVYLKDHFISTDSPMRMPYPGPEIRYNRIKSSAHAIFIGIRGEGSCEAGDQWVHHNELTCGEGGVIFCPMGEALGQSKTLRVENNILHHASTTSGVSILADSMDNIINTGNIFINAVIKIQTQYVRKITLLNESNRNVYTQFRAILNRYTSGETNFPGLPGWHAATAGTPSSLGISNPDANSVVENVVDDIVIDAANRDYRLAANSAAIGLMADGSNAGPRQYGTEIIGLLPTYSAGG